MAKSSPTPKTILIVDDEMDMRIFMKTLFKTSGYHVITARDGKEGMQKAKQHQPHLIILDVMMPEEGGVKMYQNLKTDSCYAAIPVIMLSGVGLKTFDHFLTMLRCRTEGSIPEPDCYLEKPPEPSQLLKIAEALL